MAGKTLAELVADTKILIDDSQVPDAWVEGWIMQGLADLTPALRLEARATASVLAGRDEYAAPPDLYDVRLLRLLGESGPRQALPSNDFQGTGYKLWGGAIILRPAPASDDTMELWYWRVPSSVSDVPPAFQHLLTWYAASVYQAEQKEIQVEQTSFWPKYLQGKAALARYTASRSSKHAPRQWRVVR